MEQVQSVIDFLYAYSHRAIFIYPVIGVAILYLVFRKTNELSRHALENTWATVMLYGVNSLVAVLFYEEIYAAFEATYLFLGIPTIDRSVWDGVPLAVTILLSVLANDLLGYWSHRAMHMRWLWPTHAAHHSDTFVNGFTTFRVHFLEVFLVMASQMFLLSWMGLPEMLPVVAILHTIHNVYVHQDIDIDHGPLKYLIASPRYHRWHHADVPEAYGKNLSNIVPLWDVIFGTYYCPGRCEAEVGALKSGVEDKSVTALVTYPFREWWRLLRGVRGLPETPAEAPQRREA